MSVFQHTLPDQKMTSAFSRPVFQGTHDPLHHIAFRMHQGQIATTDKAFDLAPPVAADFLIAFESPEW